MPKFKTPTGEIILVGNPDLNEELLKGATRVPDETPLSGQKPQPTDEGETGVETGGETGVVTSDPLRNQEEQDREDQRQRDRDEEDELARVERRRRIKEERDLLAGGVAPTPPDQVETFEQLREREGIPAVESEIRSIQAEKAEIRATLRKFRPRAFEGQEEAFALGRISEQERIAQERMDFLVRQEAVAVDKLNAKTRYIETVMELTQQDFENANAQYDRDFTAAKEIQSRLDQEEDELKSDARAFLSSVGSLAKENGIEFGELTEPMKAEIQKKEIQAGYPEGTMEMFMREGFNPIATVDGFDAGGNAITSFILTDENGNPFVAKTLRTGGVRADADKEDPQAKEINTFRDEAAEMAIKVSQGEVEWSEAFRILKAKYPMASDDAVISFLGEEPDFGKEE